MSAHPDDEFEMWSLVENSPGNYKVFLFLTRGEETGFCQVGRLESSLQEDLGEVPPAPTPTGRWTGSCAEARMDSTLRYLTQMSEYDSTIPGNWTVPQDVGPWPEDGTALCRDDDGTAVCGPEQRTARVWLDTEGRGAVVSWDLGDGDLTPEEAAWAIRSTISGNEALDLPPDLPVHNILGGFFNEDHGCRVYAHRDHEAIHLALWDEPFGARYHAGATCADNPDATRFEAVSTGSAEAAFLTGDDGQRLGAHTRHYGWLHGSYYHLDPVGQDQIFHSNQSFWIRRP